MLVKKVFDRSRRSRRRNWKLQRMADGLDTESVEKSVCFSGHCWSLLCVVSVGLSALCVSVVSVGLSALCVWSLLVSLLCVF